MKKVILYLLSGFIVLCDTISLQGMKITTKRVLKLPSTKIQQATLFSKPIASEKLNIAPKIGSWQLLVKPQQQISWVSSLFLRLKSLWYKQSEIVPVATLDDLINQLEEILYDQNPDKVERLDKTIRSFNIESFSYDRKKVLLYVAALTNSYIEWLKKQHRIDEIDRKSNSIIGLLADFIEYIYLLEGPTDQDWNQFLEEHTFLTVLFSRLRLLVEFDRYLYEYTDETITDLLYLPPKTSYEFVKNKYDKTMKDLDTETIMNAVHTGQISLKIANLKLALAKNMKIVWDKYYPTIPEYERNTYEYGQQQLKHRQAAKSKSMVEHEVMIGERTIHTLLGLPENATYPEIKQAYHAFQWKNNLDPDFFNKMKIMNKSEQIKKLEEVQEVNAAMKKYEDERRYRLSARE